MQPDNFIDRLSGGLEPIRELAMRLRSSGNDVSDDMVALSPRPNIAPQAYAFRAFSPLPAGAIVRYQELCGVTISPHYRAVIGELNGLDAFQFSLYGIPPSMVADPPLLNRSKAQPFDIGTANRVWKSEYAISPDWFHFGGAPYSFDENIGYFFAPSGDIHASRKGGKVLRTWPSFQQFLADELRRVEADFPAYEARMAELMASKTLSKS